MWAIFRREVHAYRFSAVGYVFAGLFLLLSGILFSVSPLFFDNSPIRDGWVNLSFLLVLLLPILTTRLFNQEHKNHVDRLIMTAPVSLISVVMGKYLAALCIWGITLLMMGLYPILPTLLQGGALGGIAGSLFGIFLLGAAFAAIGVLLSAVSESPMASMVSTVGVLLGIYLLDAIGGRLSGALGWLLGTVSMVTRLDGFVNGLLSPASIFYYVSISACCVLFTVRVLKRRRQNGD